MIRPIRIIGAAVLLAFLFRVSQRVGSAWGHESVEGYNVALGVVSLLFLVRAAATEYAGGRAADYQKDILWGLSLGAFVSMLARVLR